ncbi:hypothetical protein NA56DRAFT_649282 [Hyaloscypha hepaticicola]|uniref:Protein kinase domain-containing protein n=1 Tax=Hyaloscypha hepaticicola TaxID=2082293 RepID=A0A2J6PRS2_9HELO|nr:hypothetical protein NA56DRAFT_649282 [Hyaloscypha hepaticicola]
MADPLSVAAGAAGLISLSLQLFGSCIKGFVLLSTARNLEKDASIIVCMLNFEEIRLTEWARRAGILTDDGTLDRRLNATAVEAALRQLRDLLLDTKTLKKRYGLALVERNSTQQQTVGLLEEADSISETPTVSTGISGDIRRRILSKAGLAQEPGVLKRLWWAAVDKEKISRLVADVHSLVSALWDHLDPWRHDDLLDTTRNIGSYLVSLNNKFDQISSLAEALKALQGALQGAQQSPTDIGLNNSVALAGVKALRVGLGEGEQQQSAETPKRQTLLNKLEPLTRLKLTNFKPLKREATMGLAEYDGNVVFVEKKSLDPMTRSKILPRAQNLAALLNLPKDETFHSLTCKGIVEEGGMVSFVFNHPNPDSAGEPRSLLELFSAKDGIPPPSLTVRVQLALRVSCIVQNFHRTGWLHKNLRSENILFFPSKDEADSHEKLLTHPVLAGFAFARAGAPTEISERPSADPKRDIYRHPAALGEPAESFSADMDTYSLGTVLLEIAEWRSLRYLVDSVVDVGAADVPLNRLAEVQPFLLRGDGKGGTSKLRVKMGDIYTQACRGCLGAEIKEEDPREGNAFGASPSVLDLAVRHLERCRI